MIPRREKILERLSRQKEVSVQDLAHRFRVTPTTIRRDLDALEREGRLTRTHGGALLSRPSVIAFEFLERNQAHLAEKQAIAREVASTIEPGMTLTLDTGTTTLEVARAVAGIPDLRVLTSSLAIASVLHAHDNIELVLLGGNARKNSPDLSGPLTEENLLRFRTQIAILGADAADRKGLYTTDLGISRVSKAMIAGSERTLLVLDSSKFARSAFVRFAGWGEVDRVVTDSGIGKGDLRWLRRSVSDVRCVKV